MANPYFRNLPDFEYVNTTDEGRSISDFVTFKNLFKKGKLRDDLLQESTFFEKYTIEGDDRPDNVAYKIYGDSTLDWVVLLSNNILNIYDEWPLNQDSLDAYLREKYIDLSDDLDDESNALFNIHHYESREIKDSKGNIIFPKGLQVDNNQSVTYFDFGLNSQITLTNVAEPVTNYTYEERINNRKRDIYLVKRKYLNIIFDDLEEMMQYKEGSTQYVSETLKRGDNIRLYQ